MTRADRIPRDRSDDYSHEMASQRARFVETMTGTALDTVSSYTIDPAGATDAARGLSQPKHVAPAHPASTDPPSIIRPNARSSDLCAAFSRRVPR